MAIRRSMRLPLSTAWLVIFSCPGIAQRSPEPPEELVRRVITNEVRAEDQDHSHWMFQLETATKNSQKEIDEVLETKDGDLKRPIQINGRKLSAEESDKELERRHYEEHIVLDLFAMISRSFTVIAQLASTHRNRFS